MVLEIAPMRKSELVCRYCATPVKTDAGVCHCCGVELRAVLLSPCAIAIYVIGVLAFITFWLWQDF